MVSIYSVHAVSAVENVLPCLDASQSTGIVRGSAEPMRPSNWLLSPSSFRVTGSVNSAWCFLLSHPPLMKGQENSWN